MTKKGTTGTIGAVGTMAKILTVIIILMAGCRSVQMVPVETRTTVVERLVEVHTPADSAWLRAWLQCDSNYRVMLCGIDERKTSGMETSLTLSNNKLSYRVTRVSDTVYIPARDSIVVREIPLRVEIPVATNRLTGWQWFQVWTGRVLLGLLLILIFYCVIRWKLR
jgi:hypothetical protein